MMQRWFISLVAASLTLAGSSSIGQAQPPATLPTSDLYAQAEAADDASRQAQAEALIQAFADEDYARVRQLIAPRLQALWTAEKLAEIWDDLIQQSGPVERTIGSGIATGPISTAAPVCVEFAGRGANCSNPQNIFVVTFNPDGEIVGVNFPKFLTLTEIAEQFAGSLGAGDFAAARGEFSSDLKAERFPEQLAVEWQDLEARLGEFQAVGRVRENESEGLALTTTSMVEVEMNFARGSTTMFVLFDDNRRIVQYLFPD